MCEQPGHLFREMVVLVDSVRPHGLPGHAGRCRTNYFIMKGLILAQNERWRRGLGMQVERESAPSGVQVEWRKGE